MPDQAISDIISRYETKYSDNAMHRATCQELADFIIPWKSNIDGSKPRGSKQTEKIFDGTAPHSNWMLASSMDSSLTPANGKWFYITTRHEQLNENEEAKNWFETCSNRMMQAIHQSNFNSESHELYLDEGAFGMSAVLCKEKPVEKQGFNGLYLKTFSAGEYVISENFMGEVNTLFRKYELSANAAQKEWGKKVGEKVTKASESTKDKDKMFPFLLCIIPRDDWDGSKKKPHPWITAHINYEEKILMRMEGDWEFPVMVPRWSKTSGEENGRGPGHLALPFIKTLNKATELDLRAWAKVIDPPLFVRDRGVIGNVRTSPSGITHVKGNPSENIWIPPQGAKFDLTQIKVQDLRTLVRQIFFSDQLQLPAVKDSKEMTAFEVQVRYELMHRILGPTLGRLENEFLSPFIERVFNLMYRAGAFPPIPEILRPYIGKNIIDIKYEGPLARAQRLGDLSAVQRFVNSVAPVVQIRPDVLDNIDIDDTFRKLAEASGVKLKDPKDVQKIRDQRYKMQMAEKMKSDMERLAAGAGDVAPALTAMKDLMGGEEKTA